MIIVKSSALKNNFGHYLDAALIDGEIWIERYGVIIARLVAVKDGKEVINQRRSVASSAKRPKKAM